MRLLILVAPGIALVGCGRIYPPRDDIIAQVHARFDLDGNGLIDRREFEVFTAREVEALRFEDLDTDGDGGISPAELDTTIRQREPRPLIGRTLSAGQRETVAPEFYAKAPRPGKIP